MNRRIYALRQRTRPSKSGAAKADMEQRVTVEVREEIARHAKAEAEKLWPDQGPRALNRLAADALARYRRYCDDASGPRTKQS